MTREGVQRSQAMDSRPMRPRVDEGRYGLLREEWDYR